MTHDEVQDLLELYVDDRLDRDQRHEVDAHLKNCDECRAILDGVAVVDLSALGQGRFDEATMRRAVRVSMFRTAINAVLILLAGWIVLWFTSALVIQPLLVNRGGRAADAVRMTIDLPIMTNPGAVLVEGRIESRVLSRDVDLTFAIPVGGALEPGATTSNSIGILGVQASPTEDPRYPIFGDMDFQGEPLDQLQSLGEGTVATLSLDYETPLALEEAESIAGDPEPGVRVVWAGFDASLGRTPPLEPPLWTYVGTLGYGTCLNDQALDDEILGAQSAGFGAEANFAPASVQRALDSVIAGLENITSREELVEYVVEPFGDDPDEIVGIIADLRENPRVTMLVVTGPSPSLAQFLEASPTATSATLIGVDFYNWTPAICGGRE